MAPYAISAADGNLSAKIRKNVMGALQMKQALAALEGEPMDGEELAWMRRVGDDLYGMSRSPGSLDGAR